jgi:hypothetical protein
MKTLKILVLAGCVLLAGCANNYSYSTDAKQKVMYEQPQKSQIPGASEISKPVTVIPKPVTMPVIH